jgi:hypothetical protein
LYVTDNKANAEVTVKIQTLLPLVLTENIIVSIGKNPDQS